MHGTISAGSAAAINGHGKSAADKNDDGKSAIDDRGWFADVARILLPHKAGTALHYITGYDERLCQRYASGETKPPGAFIRLLLRSEHGWVWLSALMDGSYVPWWTELKNTSDVGRAAIEAARKCSSTSQRTASG